MITTLIVDDEDDMRMLVRTVLEVSDSNIQIVAEASDGIEAVARWRELAPPEVPTVIVIDNRMPNMSGIEAAGLILDRVPNQKIVLYSAFLDESVRAEAAAAGIAACVSKNDLHDLPGVVASFAQPEDVSEQP